MSPVILLSLLFIFIIPLPLAAQAKGSPPKAPAAAKASAPNASDAAIESRIRERFSRSKIGANGFQVKVQNGVAVLSGRTDVIQHKGTATRIARKAGARRVDNRIEVSEAARKKAADRLARNKGQAPRKVQVQRPSTP